MICLSFSACGEVEKTETVDLSLEKLAQDVMQNNDGNQAEEKEQDVESEANRLPERTVGLEGEESTQISGVEAIAIEDGDNYMEIYNLKNLNESRSEIKVPDFLAYATDNLETSESSLLAESETSENSYRITYRGDYYETLPEYVNLLESLGFQVLMDGYEGFYMLEKQTGDYLLSVNAYYMNEEDGVVVEITLQ